MPLRKSLLLVWIDFSSEKNLAAIKHTLRGYDYVELDRNVFIATGNRTELWTDVLSSIASNGSPRGHHLISTFSLSSSSRILPRGVEKRLLEMSQRCMRDNLKVAKTKT